MIGALIHGELSAEPTVRMSANGKPFWTANVRVAAGAESLFVSLATFDLKAGERLMQLRKGSALAAVGTMEATAWTAKDGTARTGWRLTAHEILSVYQAHKRRGADEGARNA